MKFVIDKLFLTVFTVCLCSCASTSNKDDIFELVSQADKAYVESRWLQASQLYSQVTVKVPQDHYAWFRLGNTQVRQGRIESAVYTYNEALKRDPNHAKTHFNLSIAYLLIAANSMQQAVNNIRPNDPGKTIVEEKLKTLQKLVDQPAESAPRYNHLPHVRGTTN